MLGDILHRLSSLPSLHVPSFTNHVLGLNYILTFLHSLFYLDYKLALRYVEWTFEPFPLQYPSAIGAVSLCKDDVIDYSYTYQRYR